MAARQGGALHPRRQLHRLVQLENLCQGRHRHLGDAIHRLPPHPPRPAQPRAARLQPRRQLQLVPVQRRAPEIPVSARPPAESLAQGARANAAGGRVARHRGGPGLPRFMGQAARARRFCARRVGRGERNHRRRQRLHGEEIRARPGHRFFPDSGHVHGLLRGRLALFVAARRRVHEFLRLVLRPAAGQPADLGRADRCAGKRRLV